MALDGAFIFGYWTVFNLFEHNPYLDLTYALLKAVGGHHQWRWTEPSSLATGQFCIVFNLFEHNPHLDLTYALLKAVGGCCCLCQRRFRGGAVAQEGEGPEGVGGKRTGGSWGRQPPQLAAPKGRGRQGWSGQSKRCGTDWQGSAHSRHVAESARSPSMALDGALIIGYWTVFNVLLSVINTHFLIM